MIVQISREKKNEIAKDNMIKRTTNANNQTYVHYTHTFYYIHTNLCLCNSYYVLNECDLSINQCSAQIATIAMRKHCPCDILRSMTHAYNQRNSWNSLLLGTSFISFSLNFNIYVFERNVMNCNQMNKKKANDLSRILHWK